MAGKLFKVNSKLSSSITAGGLHNLRLDLDKQGMYTNKDIKFSGQNTFYLGRENNNVKF
jgi:hypothetical protein